ncbi:calcium/sodium antiporter [Altererythrobacter arenosus]|uniref:Calcium/sodium antiporter n=1 Tax=Altererythrobacter arenosus TaxID=3032592 RepID=A0ABY8G0U2_9SPHN|nr:calcium/sodium antiporter [Altererythrobacter sp. CAU 1644]WFL77899.1 calcium/sodium antiporter [Altererythrobacter sp. CAU 1644]
MIEAILLSIAGLVGLAIGGEFLVRGAVGIAKRLGVSNLVTGLVIVGAATSMPEMVASVEAALMGSPELAWGNVVGSNLANTLLILGVAALVMPIALTGMGRRDAIVALAATALLWLITGLQLGSIWVGAGLLFGIVAYIYWRYNHPRVTDEPEEETPALAIHWAIACFAVGVVLLVAGGNFLVTGAIDMARYFNVSETVIGLTVVAVGTSLPELAASVAAALRGKPGLALGNVLGSNIYNILLIGGVTMSVAPVPVPDSLLTYQMVLLFASAVALLVLLSTARQIGRVAGSALVMIFAVNTAYAFAG